MKTIPLTQGQVALVDDADHAALSRYKWCARRHRGTWYALRGVRVGNGKSRFVHMHREVAAAAPGTVVDHINHDGLDNRRENLRVCDAFQNQWNRRGPQRGSTSGYRGVSFHKAAKRWVAQIRVRGKQIYLGLHDSAQEASLVYAAANRKYFGEFGGWTT